MPLSIIVCFLVVFMLAIGAVGFERARPSSRIVALIAMMAALAAVSRVMFSPLPNLKPTTDIIFFSGFGLGPLAGVSTGVFTALAGNFIFGQGTWTIWQMLGWGGVGLVGAGVAKARISNRWALALSCAALGFIYGQIMNFSVWLHYIGDHSFKSFLAIASTSLPFDLTHALGNALFCILLGPEIARILRRFKRRVSVRWIESKSSSIS